MWGDLSGPRVLAPSCVLCVETQPMLLGDPLQPAVSLSGELLV